MHSASLRGCIVTVSNQMQHAVDHQTGHLRCGRYTVLFGLAHGLIQIDVHLSRDAIIFIQPKTDDVRRMIMRQKSSIELKGSLVVNKDDIQFVRSGTFTAENRSHQLLGCIAWKPPTRVRIENAKTEAAHNSLLPHRIKTPTGHSHYR